MDILIELTYAALVFAAFKIFKFPVNKWTVTTAVVGGIFVVGFIFLSMAYYHPYTTQGRIYFQTTPIMPQVRGKVIKVGAVENAQLKKGDMLFELDPTPFQKDYDNAKAALNESRAKKIQLEKQVDSARADVQKFDAAMKLANVTEKRMSELWDKQVIAKQEYDQARAKAKEAQERYHASQADLSQAQATLMTQQAVIDEAEAAVGKAQFNLDSTVVTAPTDGYVTQVRLRPGMMAVPLPLSPVMTFVSADGSYLIGAFKQNPLQNIKVGNRAEVIFPAIPGRAFSGHVTKIMEAIGEGQLSPDAKMMRFEGDIPAGRVPVFIKLDEDMSQWTLPVGCEASMTSYSESMEFLAPIRQILLRMMSWKNIICFEVL